MNSSVLIGLLFTHIYTYTGFFLRSAFHGLRLHLCLSLQCKRSAVVVKAAAIISVTVTSVEQTSSPCFPKFEATPLTSQINLNRQIIKRKTLHDVISNPKPFHLYLPSKAKINLQTTKYLLFTCKKNLILTKNWLLLSKGGIYGERRTQSAESVIMN